MGKAGPALTGRIGQWRRSAEYLSEHLPPFFESRAYVLVVSELAQCVDSESMQQQDGSAFALVVLGNMESVEGREYVYRVHSD